MCGDFEDRCSGKTSNNDVSDEFVCSANDGDGHLFQRTGRFSKDGMVEELRCVHCGKTKTDQ